MPQNRSADLGLRSLKFFSTSVPIVSIVGILILNFTGKTKLMLNNVVQ